jgi:Sulfotransferase domain
VGPPDFVGVGAQRSGSSWWYRMALEAHPRVVRVDQRLKEIHYFDRFWDGNLPADATARYHSYFPRPEGALTGEWTPRYMFDHWSMRMLREAAPDARILVILRDPLERFRSGFASRRRIGVARGRTLDELGTAVARGAYTDQLRRVFDLYPRDQVLVLQYERCTRDTRDQVERTHRFLGLEPHLDELPARERVRSPAAKPELPAGIREDLVARLAPDVERLLGLCPEIDPDLWPNFRHVSRRAAPA